MQVICTLQLAASSTLIRCHPLGIRRSTGTRVPTQIVYFLVLKDLLASLWHSRRRRWPESSLTYELPQLPEFDRTSFSGVWHSLLKLPGAAVAHTPASVRGDNRTAGKILQLVINCRASAGWRWRGFGWSWCWCLRSSWCCRLAAMLLEPSGTELQVSCWLELCVECCWIRGSWGRQLKCRRISGVDASLVADVCTSRSRVEQVVCDNYESAAPLVSQAMQSLLYRLVTRFLEVPEALMCSTSACHSSSHSSSWVIKFHCAGKVWASSLVTYVSRILTKCLQIVPKSVRRVCVMQAIWEQGSGTEIVDYGVWVLPQV